MKSHAGTIDPRVPDEKYVKYGSEHKCVLRLKGRFKKKENENKQAHFEASAVAIDPNWIVTAAHIVKEAEQVMVVVDERELVVRDVFINEKFDEDKMGFSDIALGRCDQGLGLDFYPMLHEDEDEVGKVVSISGYGMTGTFSSGGIRWDGKKRAGSNIIERTEKDCLVCVTTDARTEMEFLPGSGDSGGGLFIDGKLAGINSFVMAADKKPNSDYGDESGHTRISKYKKWIADVMKEKSVNRD